MSRWRESLLHNVLYILRMRLGEPGLVFDSLGADVFENQPVDIVNIVDADNRQVEGAVPPDDPPARAAGMAASRSADEVNQ